MIMLVAFFGPSSPSCVVIIVGMLLFVSLMSTIVLAASFALEEHEPGNKCWELEKGIMKEYDCCIQDGLSIFSADTTKWFPNLPVLTESSEPLNDKALRNFSDLYCRHEHHNLQCINKMSRRIASMGRHCLSETTSQTVRTNALIQSQRTHFLCDNDARYVKEIYIHEGNKCLRNRDSFLCTKYIIKENFDIEARKYRADCRKFRQLSECLADEWRSECGKATKYLIGLLRKIYELLHCPEIQHFDEMFHEMSTGTNHADCQLALPQFLFLVISFVLTTFHYVGILF